MYFAEASTAPVGVRAAFTVVPPEPLHRAMRTYRETAVSSKAQQQLPKPGADGETAGAGDAVGSGGAARAAGGGAGATGKKASNATPRPAPWRSRRGPPPPALAVHPPAHTAFATASLQEQRRAALAAAAEGRRGKGGAGAGAAADLFAVAPSMWDDAERALATPPERLAKGQARFHAERDVLGAVVRHSTP